MKHADRIKTLNGAIAVKSAEIDKLFEKQESFTADDLKAMKEKTSELDGLNDELETVQKAQKASARSAVSATDDETRVSVQSTEKLTAEKKIGIAIGALLKNKQDGSKSIFAHMDDMGYGAVAKEFADFRAKSTILNASNAVNGGILVPTDMANEIVEILRPNTTILQVPSMRRIPMPNGNYKLPAGATGSSASYQQEADPAGVTGITFREVDLSAKTLTALIPVTNDLINFSISGAMSFVQQDLRNGMSQGMDSNLWRGDGTKGNPTGILKLAGINSDADTNTNAPTYTQVDTFARVLINRLVSAYIPDNGDWAWVMPTRVTGYLQDLRSSTGVPIYPGMQAARGAKMFKGYPVLETTNFPVNLNTRSSNDDTEIALVAGSQIVFGESMPLELAVSSEAAIEINGGVQSMFQRRMTAVLAVMQHDINTRHLLAVALGTGVRWGA